MTTPQPAALPELPEGVTLEDLLIPLRSALGTCHDTDWTLRQFKTHITHALAALAALQSQPAAAGVSDADLYGTLEATIVSRYIVEKRVGGGFWGYCVKAGDGAQEVFVGHKNACEHVRQALQTACLDVAYMAHEKARAILALRPQSDTLCFELSAMLGCPPSDTDVVACVSSLLTPRPQAVPMTEADLLKCLIQANCLGTVHMSHEHGPYYVDRPSHAAVRLKDAIEAHHGIPAQGAQGEQA